MKRSDLVVIDPEIVHGTPVVAGTRVPVEMLFQWLREGYTINEFLESFPTVSREKLEGILDESCSLLIAQRRNDYGGMGDR